LKTQGDFSNLSDDYVNSPVAKNINEHAANANYGQYTPGVCDAVYIYNMKMDLSAVNALNCTVELKLIVDSVDLPAGVTDNAFYTLKLTNVDCKNAATE
jgi:hypothetical protein